MKRVIISENQRGFLFKNGKYAKMLMPGKHYAFGGRRIEVCNLDAPIKADGICISSLLADPEVKKVITVMEVADGHYGLHFVNGRFSGIYMPDTYAFFTMDGEHEFKIVDVMHPQVGEDIPETVFNNMLPSFYTRIEVAENKRGLLFYNRKFEKLLEPGVYYFWRGGVKPEVTLVDTRLLQFEVSGQEMLTLDKVTVRVNFVCNYKITDYVKAVTEIDDYGRQLHVAAQLVIREYIGKYRLDELLENKDKAADQITEKLSAAAKRLYLEISDAGIKDVILPGEIRDIMNTVLVAEKRAQASVIARREEVASTRSLLNTAKLMEENATLYKLKELEYVERICENVGNINIGGGDFLAQLTAIISGKHD